MASTTTINSMIDRLATTILATSASGHKQQRRKQLETFRRRMKNHNYGRTNQFDIKDKLDGLEEKFQIRDRDDLSDAMYQRRIELTHHDNRWIPDVLDLLLRLSNDPINKANPAALYDIEPHPSAPLPLKWAQIEGDDTLEKDDPIWIEPAWSDLSSEEDELELLPDTDPPSSIKRTRSQNASTVVTAHRNYEQTTASLTTLPRTLTALLQSDPAAGKIVVSEMSMIRETLLVLRGYPASAFITDKAGEIYLNKNLHVQGLSKEIPNRLLRRVAIVRRQISLVHQWTQKEASFGFLQAVQHGIEELLNDYLSWVNRYTQALLDDRSSMVISLLRTVDLIESQASLLKVATAFVQAARKTDEVGSLELLYHALHQHYLCANDPGFEALLPIFLKAFWLYLQPLEKWINEGVVKNSRNAFFIYQKSNTASKSTLWHDWFGWEVQGPCRPPNFLLDFAETIFMSGKTSALLQNLRTSSEYKFTTRFDPQDLLDALRSAAEDKVIPFSAAFSSILGDRVSGVLHQKTANLKDLLDRECKMTQTLDAFDIIYLRKSGVLVDNLESKLFRRIDKFQTNWNDRFLVAEMVQDVYKDAIKIDMEAILVHSVHTSSRSMESRRRSVKIMSAIAIEYVLPWPIANIIPNITMTAYRQISLHLSQIRRAKYMLERIAFPSVYTNATMDDANDQKQAQTLTFMFCNFINVLYDHFTGGVIEPLTNTMRGDLRQAQTLDEMIKIHKTYVSKVRHSCLVSKNMKVLREALIALLDMCIRFADLVSMKKEDLGVNLDLRRKTSDDFETSSFMSAQSESWRHRRRAQRRHRRRQREKRHRQGEDDVLLSSSSISDDDDDSDTSGNADGQDTTGENEGEGYSSFIVLDEDTTVALEIQKLKVQFKRQLDFFIAGLQGASRGTAVDDSYLNPGQSFDDMSLLADRLTWK